MEKRPFVVLAGVPGGLGDSFAYECAARGHNLLLLGKSGLELDKISDTIQDNFQVDVISLEIDLMEPTAPARVLEKIQIEEIEIFMLINNYGLDQTVLLEQQDIVQIRTMCDVEGEACISLVRTLLPELQIHYDSYVINVGSLALYCLLSGKSSCWVTNNFFARNARSLRAELRNYEISISTLCPGLMILNSGEGLKHTSKNWLTNALTMHPDEIAKVVLTEAMSGTKTIIPGWLNKVVFNGLAVLPASLRRKVIVYVMRKLQKSNPRPKSENRSPLSGNVRLAS